MRLLLYSVLLSVCILPFFGTADANGTSINLYRNLTICELNGTVSNFTLAVETFAVAPIATYFLSKQFATTAYFIDSLVLLAIAIAGFAKRAYLLSGIFAFSGGVALVCFVNRVVRNCMALRYSCTRRTNFIVGTNGNWVRNKSTVLVQENGRVRVGKTIITPKWVVIGGRLAEPTAQVPVEKWST